MNFCNQPYHNMKAREEDDERKSKTIKNQTHLQSSYMIDPAVPDRHGQAAVTRPTQYATHHERERWNDGMSTDVDINCDLLISELLLVVLLPVLFMIPSK